MRFTILLQQEHRFWGYRQELAIKNIYVELPDLDFQKFRIFFLLFKCVKLQKSIGKMQRIIWSTWTSGPETKPSSVAGIFRFCFKKRTSNQKKCSEERIKYWNVPRGCFYALDTCHEYKQKFYPHNLAGNIPINYAAFDPIPLGIWNIFDLGVRRAPMYDFFFEARPVNNSDTRLTRFVWHFMKQLLKPHHGRWTNF